MRIQLANLVICCLGPLEEALPPELHVTFRIQAFQTSLEVLIVLTALAVTREWISSGADVNIRPVTQALDVIGCKLVTNVSWELICALAAGNEFTSGHDGRSVRVVWQIHLVAKNVHHCPKHCAAQIPPLLAHNSSTPVLVWDFPVGLDHRSFSGRFVHVVIAKVKHASGRRTLPVL